MTETDRSTACDLFEALKQALVYPQVIKAACTRVAVRAIQWSEEFVVVILRNLPQIYSREAIAR